MMFKWNKEIYWGEFKGGSSGDGRQNTFLYGSIVLYHSRDHVYLENTMVNSGTMIHEWTSSFNFQGNRLTPTLPLLKKGHSYRLTSQMTVQPQNGLYFRLIFMDRYDRQVGQVIEKNFDFTFTYPEDAYHYKVQLLSAGFQSVDFHSFSIEEDYSEQDVEK
ncbi:accessory Sec system protein Asp3 [Streptococcus mitis SK569]|jgi:accessory sec system protein asp3|uniref:accessory Sec system protein Asp3 n=1 Tax=Streptococcus sp. KHUD_015 TaxID=3434352 RepID=UPI00021BD503|nr:accessory Sec system protein Asp3 [Streptococcus mitis SK569]EID19619.1 accessory Sec system protein Asp3 [Streptococcus mitis SK616]MQP96538.1 accessory Sec system protein Asp3 [Streptococcus mitis]MQQ13895.1 accessory Sec system protein Asp3 [Streptococcus mitis]MQQ44833.1 accessory Sec system protein Asp3 [Streptococcus mitis]